MLFEFSHLCFRNFDPAVSFDVIRVKFYVDGFFINNDNRIEIPEACMPTIKKHDSWLETKLNYGGTISTSWNNNKDQNVPMTEGQNAPMTKHQGAT